MSDNWVVQNLENALNTWNEKLAFFFKVASSRPSGYCSGGYAGALRRGF